MRAWKRAHSQGLTLLAPALIVYCLFAVYPILALGLNQNIPLRALFYMPVIIASIAVATMWRWMYDPFFGLFNAVLTALGRDGLIQDWLGDRNVALYSMFVAYVWQTVGFSLVLFLAGLQNVSPTLIEASRVDGANRFQAFRYVTLPALRSLSYR